MMTTNKTNQSAAWKYALVLPILIGLVFIFSCKESQVTDITTAEPKTETTPKSSPETYTEAEMENIYKVVEEMPRFPGCENINDMKERKTCADKKMLQYIYENLKYPNEAKEAGIDGQCVVQFIVSLDGSIENIKVVRDIGGGCGEAVRSVILSMNEMSEKWISGRQGGKPVKVMYTLPVKFKIEDNGVGFNDNRVNKSIEDKINEGYMSYQEAFSKKRLNQLENKKGKPLCFIDGIETDISHLDKINYKADSMMFYMPSSAKEKYGERGKYGAFEYYNASIIFKN
jgi:protein TonB